MEKFCRWFGHKWRAVYVHGYYHDIQVKFIGAYCVRCFKGREELLHAIDAQTERIYGTWSEKYFDDPQYNKSLITDYKKLAQQALNEPDPKKALELYEKALEAQNRQKETG